MTSQLHSSTDHHRTGLATPEQVAEFMQVSRSLVYSMMADGTIPFCRVGRLRRVRWSDVESYLQSCAA